MFPQLPSGFIPGTVPPTAIPVPPPPTGIPVPPAPPAILLPPLFRTEQGRLTTSPPPNSPAVQQPAGFRDPRGRFLPFEQPTVVTPIVPEAVPPVPPPVATPVLPPQLPNPQPLLTPNPPVYSAQQEQRDLESRYRLIKTQLQEQQAQEEDYQRRTFLGILASAVGGVRSAFVPLNIAATGFKANRKIAEDAARLAEPVPEVVARTIELAAIQGFEILPSGRLVKLDTAAVYDFTAPAPIVPGGAIDSAAAGAAIARIVQPPRNVPPTPPGLALPPHDC